MSVEQRLVRAERRGKWTSWTAVVALVVAALALVRGTQGPGKPADLPGRALRVTDAQGRVRVSIDVDERGTCRLVLYDADSTERVAMEVSEDGVSTFAMRGQKGAARLRARVDEAGLPDLVFFDRLNRQRVLLGTGYVSDGFGLEISDDKGTRLVLDVDHSSPELSFFSPDTGIPLRLGTARGGVPFIDFDDRNGIKRLELSVTDDEGRPYIALRDDRQGAVAVLGHVEGVEHRIEDERRVPGCKLSFLSGAGELSWQAPEPR